MSFPLVLCLEPVTKKLRTLIPGIRIYDEDIISTDATESAALLHKIEMIDIYSNSWGPGDAGFEVQGPGILSAKALELGIQKVSLVNCLQNERIVSNTQNLICSTR